MLRDAALRAAPQHEAEGCASRVERTYPWVPATGPPATRASRGAPRGDERIWRSSIPLAAVFGDEGVAAREREHDLAADAGGGLAAAIGENDDAEALLRDHADVGRGVAQPAVLVDEGDVAVAHHLPGERLGEALADREHALLRQRHRLLQRALVRQHAEIGGEEHRHVAGGGVHLPGARPVEHAL